MSEHEPSASWNDLPDIDHVRGVGEVDLAIFEEIRAVLKRHNALDRFGISLLHKHFPLDDDEALVEVCDKDLRRLSIGPVKIGEVEEGKLVETSWRLTEGSISTMTKCQLRCYVDEDRVHNRVHWP
jgi:hypothetical protein